MSHKRALLLTVTGCLVLTVCSCRQRGGDADVAPKRKSFAYKVEGPWYIGDPVHEVLTLLSIRSAIEDHGSRGNLLAGISTANLPKWDSPTAHNTNVRTTHPSVHQFLRGVFWPDDPEGLLFSNKTDAANISSGFQWQRAFGADPSQINNITARSHYGDLQYLHSMSPNTSLSAQDVRRQVLRWAAFLVDVSAGRIAPDASLASIPAVAGRFPTRTNVRDLFVADASMGDIGVRQRAVGALLHLIQDSHAHGHIKRSGDGTIVAFHNYNDPDHDRSKHALDDSWGAGATLKARVANTPGAADAVAQGTRVLVLVNNNAPKPTIIEFLGAEVFGSTPP